jgi:hypothetical protein
MEKMLHFIPENNRIAGFLFARVKGEQNNFLYATVRTGFLLAMIFFISYVPGFAQTIKMENKIDPAFRSILAQKKQGDTSVVKICPSPVNVAPTEGFVPGKKLPEKRYDCIVYTKNAKALRDSGIIINSVLPTFVTAWVTLEQIIQMAAMPDVTYIEAPRTNGLYGRRRQD